MLSVEYVHAEMIEYHYRLWRQLLWDKKVVKEPRQEGKEQNWHQSSKGKPALRLTGICPGHHVMPHSFVCVMTGNH